MPINRNKLDASLVVFFVIVNTTAYLNPFDNSAPDLATPSVTASATPSATASTKQTQPVPTAEPVTDLFADYTPTGVKVTWVQPAASKLVTSYLVQASFAGTEFETVATVEPGITSVEFEKIDTPESTAYRVIAVYKDGQATSNSSVVKGKYSSK